MKYDFAACVDYIDSAPQDGTPILGFIPSWYQKKGGWCVVLWHKEGWHTVGGSWRVLPSHWMPLPDAPSSISPHGRKP